MNLELIKAIVVLPGTALVYVPGAILWLVTELGLGLAPARLAQPRLWIGLVLGVSGFALAVWTVASSGSSARAPPHRGLRRISSSFRGRTAMSEIP